MVSREPNPNNWRPQAGPAPLTPEYQKRFEEITAEFAAGGAGNWPPTYCIPSGMPAMMSLYDPAEIVVTPNTTYILISHDSTITAESTRTAVPGRKIPCHVCGVLDRPVGR